MCAAPPVRDPRVQLPRTVLDQPSHKIYTGVKFREGQDSARRFWEIGVIGHGPRAIGLADDDAAAIGEWTRDYGTEAPARGFRMATDAARELLTAPDSRFVIDKPRIRIVADWP